MKQEKLVAKKNPTKKEKELAISRRNVQRLSAEISFAREILRRVVKAATEKGIEIKLSLKEKEWLTLG